MRETTERPDQNDRHAEDRTRQPWTKPQLRCISAKAAEGGQLLGPEVIVLLS